MTNHHHEPQDTCHSNNQSTSQLSNQITKYSQAPKKPAIDPGPPAQSSAISLQPPANQSLTPSLQPPSPLLSISCPQARPANQKLSQPDTQPANQPSSQPAQPQPVSQPSHCPRVPSHQSPATSQATRQLVANCQSKPPANPAPSHQSPAPSQPAKQAGKQPANSSH